MRNLNKGIIIVMMLAVSVFLTACGGTGSTGTGKTFIGGTEGLKSTLIAGNPPDKITDGGTTIFSIVLKLENVGENKILANEGYVKIEGMDPGLYSTNIPEFKKYFSEPIEAARSISGSVLSGGISTVEFPELKYKSTIQGDMVQPFQADVCYKYSTKMVAQICVKNSAEQALSSQEICSVEGEKNPQNSGGPVQITSLKESYAGTGKIGISMIIEHTGSGDAIFKNDKLDCNNGPGNNDNGKVKLTFKNVEVAGKSVPVECLGSTDGYVRLFKDTSGKYISNSIYCTIDVSGGKNIVQVPIEAELGYVYLQHVSQQITIQHVLI